MDFDSRSSKKNVAHVVYTAAQLKGRRLRMARALTGLSRNELYEKINISALTIDTWESGRVELTEKNSARICEALRLVGIYCSSEWLLAGEGVPPRIMGDLERSMVFFSDSAADARYHLEANTSVGSKKIPSFLREEIRKELNFFMELHKDALFHIADRDSFNCRYREGDCLAGVKENLQNLVGKIVIGELQNGISILCRLSSHSNGESEVCIAGETSSKLLNIVSASEIIWHRTNKSFN